MSEAIEVAEVILSMGRQHLTVRGVVVATEGDQCRDPLYLSYWDAEALKDAAKRINEGHWTNWEVRFNET